MQDQVTTITLNRGEREFLVDLLADPFSYQGRVADHNADADELEEQREQLLNRLEQTR